MVFVGSSTSQNLRSCLSMVVSVTVTRQLTVVVGLQAGLKEPVRTQPKTVFCVIGEEYAPWRRPWRRTAAYISAPRMQSMHPILDQQDVVLKCGANSDIEPVYWTEN